MLLNWLPWKYVVRRVARSSGFVDPISLLARLHSFAEPTEVTAPLESLRAGVVFHARGLMNASCIQHNRDWIWPLWVERQFDPGDEAFLPRAFSITHVNLTHRNWTAVGIPGCDHLPIVDPRGLLTPYWDGWSIDGWIFQNDGARLIPSRVRAVQQQLSIADGLVVTTEAHQHAMRLRFIHKRVSGTPMGKPCGCWTVIFASRTVPCPRLGYPSRVEPPSGSNGNACPGTPTARPPAYCQLVSVRNTWGPMISTIGTTFGPWRGCARPVG